MSELKSDEVALKRDVFNGMIDELIDALGWLLVIGDEYPDVLRKTCGHLNVGDRLAQMSAVLCGKMFDKRYDIAYSGTSRDEEPSCGAAELPTAASHGKADSLESWKRALEQENDRDGHNA